MQQLIGLTGGIGSGKSALAAELRKLGLPVYDSDQEARRIINTHPDVRRELCELFGRDVYLADGIDRRGVADIVFRDPLLLQRMNAIVHPRVRTDVEEWARACANEPLLFLESAILYQSGFDSLCHKTVWVTAPVDLRVKRVMQRDGAAEEAVRLRMARQTGEAEFMQRADMVVENDGSKPLADLANEIRRRFSA